MMEPMECIWTYVLRLLIIFSWSDVVLTQNDVTTGWTFSPGGYVAFYPNVSVIDNQRFGVDFRTKEAHGLLFCHTIKEYNITEFPQLKHYRFCAELFQGYIRVVYSLNGREDVIKIGKVLNDDTWHRVEVFLDTSTGILETVLDSLPKKSENLKAYAWSDPRSLLDWSRLQSVVIYGGLGKSKAEFKYNQFIGCMKDLKHLDKGVFWDVKAFSNISDVSPGCIDQCLVGNPCQAGAHCINMYDRALCDCFGTGHEGEQCEIQEPTEVTLQGFEWLTYYLYERPEDRFPASRGRYSIQFKSSRASGVLLYAVGNIVDGRTGHTHVIASVHNGVVKASLAFSDQHKVEQEMGMSLNDDRKTIGRWHNLTITHDKAVVDFYLDGVQYHKVSKTTNYYLSLDPVIYIGGGHNLVQTTGLQVTRNFVGCVKNIYINEDSVLYQLQNNISSSNYHGGHQIQFGCQDVQNISMTFPKSGSMILLNGYWGNELTASFELRTVRDEALIFCTQLDLLTADGNIEYLYFEVWIHDRMPLMKFIPLFSDDTRVKTSRVPMEVSNNRWHTISIIISQRQVKVIADNVAKLYDFGSTVEVQDQIVIGYGSRNYEDHEGFVGCIRNLILNNVMFDPIEKLNSPPSPGDIISGVIMDSCRLIDFCQDTSPCEHNGKCLSDWMGVSCDCSHIQYEGKTCQFSKYRPSCDSYYQAGSQTSGVYIIDVDGPGDMEPTYVRCNMGYISGEEQYGQTIVDHNLEQNTQIRGHGMLDIMKIIQYREMSYGHLTTLTSISAWCEQHIQYSCFKAPLRLGDLTTFKAASGEIVDYIGTSRSRACSCKKDNSCSPNMCHCESGESQWKQIEGYISATNQLPITEITAIQGGDAVKQSSNGSVSMGPLKCWGNKESVSSMAVTFKSGNSYLQVPRMSLSSSGDLQFSFRTHQNKAVLLYQAGSTNNTNSFRITLMSDKLLKFQFSLHGADVEMDINSKNSAINDGEWHHIMIEINRGQLRLNLDMQRKIIDLPGDAETELKFAGDMFVGGVPFRFNPSNLPGLVGCMKGMKYNGVIYSLAKDLDESMSDIVLGCTAYCKDSQPCKNGATCIEKWDSYQCICTNKWAHSGRSCEININDDVVTFTGSDMSYLNLNVGNDPRLIDSTILLSFRTMVHQGILFYMYDELNNFIQLEIKTGFRLVLSFNQLTTIQSIELSIADIADGKWKQVVIQTFENGNFTKLSVIDSRNRSKFFPFRRFKLQQYSMKPFASPETVVPTRSTKTKSPFVRLLVGGAPINSSSAFNFKGCIRGLKIGDRIVDLQDNARKNKYDVETACDSGCASSPCKNSGVCTERWGRSEFHCNCDNSDYTGKTCNMEASGVFDGTNAVQYTYIPYGPAVETTSEEFSFVFKSNCTKKNWMMLLLWCSSKEPNHHFIVVNLHPTDGMMVQFGEASINRVNWQNGTFCDGKPHRFHYIRELDVLKVGMDRRNYNKVLTSTMPMKRLDTIVLGGIVHDHSLENVEILQPSKGQSVQNFTGCLSEVIFTPSKQSSRIQPMKELRELKNGSITVFGPEVVQCSPLSFDPTTEETDTLTTTDTQTTEGTGMTMHPWTPGPAETITLNAPIVPPTKRPFPTTTVTTSRPITVAPIVVTKPPDSNLTGAITLTTSDMLDPLTMWIAISILTVAILVAMIIAIILKCIKRHQAVYYLKQSQYRGEYEMKQPLNSTVPCPPLRPQSIHMPLATFDEFSMVSATLGPSMRRKENGFAPGKVHTLPADLRNTEYPVQKSFQPLPEQGSDFPLPNVYSKKKNRPASSISEVLEEMERQRKAKELGVDPDAFEDSPKSARSSVIHGESGELEWDPQTDRTPLTVGLQRDTIYEEYIYKVTPTRLNRSLPQHVIILENPDEDDMNSTADNISSSTDSDPLKVLEEQNDLQHEYNGDSGYEAESQRNGEDDNLLLDQDTVDMITPPTPDDSKMYYDISCMTYTPHDSPSFASTPRKMLITHVENGT